MNLVGLMLYKGIPYNSSVYYLNKLSKQGFIVVDHPKRFEKYYSLSPIDFDYMLNQIKKSDNIMSDYDTFLKYLYKYPIPYFKRTELEEHMRNFIHEGFTAARFNSWLQKAVKENRISKEKGKGDGYRSGTLVYEMLPENITESGKKRVTFRNIYEHRIALKIFSSSHHRMLWKDLKKDLVDTYGTYTGNKKLVRAMNNLVLKNYIRHDPHLKAYVLNIEPYDFEYGFKVFRKRR